MAWFRLAPLCLALLAPLSVSAQDYPTRPITLVVPFAAGGSSDVNARLIAEQMSRHLGQPIVIENIGGAGGAVALAHCPRSARPDAGPTPGNWVRAAPAPPGRERPEEPTHPGPGPRLSPRGTATIFRVTETS